MMPYADRLGRLGHWFAQLWAESLGKNGQGTAPISCLGPGATANRPLGKRMPLEQTTHVGRPSGSGPHKHNATSMQVILPQKGSNFRNAHAVDQAANRRGGDQACAAAACRPASDVPACASTTAIAVMLTMPRGVTEGVRMCAGRAAPMRIGPTGSASASTWIAW